MSTRINTNINALNALKSLNDVNGRMAVAQLRLATGKKINTAADDAAGYTIAKKFNAGAEGLGQALNNIGSAKNLVAVAEGHLNNIVDILTQMKTKATRASDDSLGTAERTSIKAGTCRIVKNRLTLKRRRRHGTRSRSLPVPLLLTQLQVACSSSSGLVAETAARTTHCSLTCLRRATSVLIAENVGFSAYGLRLDAVTPGGANSTRLGGGTLAGSLVGSSASAQALMGRIDTAIADVSEALSYIGSVVNRLSYQESSLTVAKTTRGGKEPYRGCRHGIRAA